MGRRNRSRVGIWVMPDNQSPGALEQFIATLIPGNDPHWADALLAAENAHKKAPRFRNPQDLPKAHLHTWLAWHKEPGVPPGRAMASGYFATDSDIAMRFMVWFRNLFDVLR